jgi:endonuclease-3
MKQRRISRLVKKIENTLAEHYGKQKFTAHGCEVEVLVSTILSQNTSDINSKAAFRNLKSKYPSWKKVVEAGRSKIEDAIRCGGLAKQKANSIYGSLKRINAEHGRISLTALKNMSTETALKYLISLPGVGEKTAACVLLFSLGREIMPVDTYIHRITWRLGFVSKSSERSKSFKFWFGQYIDDYYTFHLNLVKHGRLICKSGQPRCGDCVIRKSCLYHEKHVNHG